MKYFNNSDVGFVFSSANIYHDSDKKITASGQNTFLPRSGIYNISKYESFFLKYIMSPTSFIIKKRESGLLVSKENDWELNICKVLEESNFRKILISHSAKMVWKHHSFTQKTLKKITSVLV